MIRVIGLLTAMVCMSCSNARAQSFKLPASVSDPIVTDTASTFFFPVRYNDVLNSDNKIAIAGNFYANILCYNFLEDRSVPLFPENTFIEAFIPREPYLRSGQPASQFKNIVNDIILLLVKDSDTNRNGRIDNHDPTRVYTVSAAGKNLTLLSAHSENIVSFDVFEKQGIAVFRIQFDTDGDGSFRKEDKRFYYRTLNLSTMKLGTTIEAPVATGVQ